ncbi:MAG: D-alanyl-D-alanine carboxypeptidase [Hyphomicrobiales bacterium]
MVTESKYVESPGDHRNSRRALVRHGFLVVVVSLLWSIGLDVAPARAAANAKFAAIAIDAHSGKVLFSRHADSHRYPASLTKVMTLYILFQELQAGRLTKNTTIAMSKHAASMPPSKLGLKAGQTISVDNAIRALTVVSANDIAVAIAEAVLGSEAAFVRRMNKTALALAMTSTHFCNASGLYSKKQVTTARDMATLALHVQRDFPQFYRYFSLARFTYRGRSHRNHNHLLGRYKGVDGLKTGYVHASGYNLLTSLRRGGRHLVGVVMGGRSVASRDRYMASMLDRTLSRVPARKSLHIAQMAGAPPHYKERSVRMAFRNMQQAFTTPKPLSKPVMAAVGQGGNDAVIPQESRQILAQWASVAQGDIDEDALDAPLGDGAITGENRRIQVGAFASRDNAQNHLHKVMAAGLPNLGGKTALVVAAMRGATMLYRVQIAGFDKAEAAATCKALIKRSFACFLLSSP